jgi:hypothetical protein
MWKKLAWAVLTGLATGAAIEFGRGFAQAAMEDDFKIDVRVQDMADKYKRERKIHEEGYKAQRQGQNESQRAHQEYQDLFTNEMISHLTINSHQYNREGGVWYKVVTGTEAIGARVVGQRCLRMMTADDIHKLKRDLKEKAA